MESAFGVEHGEVSKAKGRIAAAFGRAADEWKSPEMRYHRGALKVMGVGGVSGAAGYQGGKTAVKNSKKR